MFTKMQNEIAKVNILLLRYHYRSHTQKHGQRSQVHRQVSKTEQRVVGGRIKTGL